MNIFYTSYRYFILNYVSLSKKISFVLKLLKILNHFKMITFLLQPTSSLLDSHWNMSMKFSSMNKLVGEATFKFLFCPVLVCPDLEWFIS